MRICIVGAGYVGLTTAAALADFGHQVHCVDVIQAKIDSLSQGKVPLYEPGLEQLVVKNCRRQRLSFSLNLAESLRSYPIILIAVGTPPQEDGSSNLTYLKQVVERIAATIKETNAYKLIIIKSTVPPGTNEYIHHTLIETGVEESLFDIVSNPEFLREGAALWDIFHPHKLVFGAKTERPWPILKNLYPQKNAALIFTSLTGAELIKYAGNAFLAAKISFANEIACICEAYGVDYQDIQKGLAADPRIGGEFLQAGLGFGGSCLPKDLTSLRHSASARKVTTRLLDAALEINAEQIELYVNKLSSVLAGLTEKQITVWGLTFKPDTDDVRSSPAVALIKQLQLKGCRVHTYDPMVRLDLEDAPSFSDQYEALHNSDALIIATAWEQFLTCNWPEVKSRLKGNLILDARNCLDKEIIRRHGFTYLGVGRP